MADIADREFLRSVFLMEAWDTVASIEDALAGIKGAATGAESGALVASPEAGRERAIETLVLVTHRLKGSAALNGFAGIARLAEGMETVVEHARDGDDVAAAIAPLGDLLAALKPALDAIAAGGADDVDELTAAVIRAAVVVRAPSPTGRLLAELDRFYADAGDVLGYFGPEAAEHLETMSEALLALERDGAGEAEIARLFRAVHTLKGAAYTVGCRVVGDLAHRMEDLLGAVRDGQLTLSPAIIEAVFAGLDALRALTPADGEPPRERAALMERASALLDALPLPEPPAEAPAAAAPAEDDVVAAKPAATVERPSFWPPLRPEASSLAPAPRFTPLRPTTAEPAPAARPTIRVNIDRLDELMNLVGELVIARSRLERRLAQFERVGDLLGFSRSRMSQIVGAFEQKYADPRLPAPSNGAPEPDVTHGFAELEFDRYDDFAILARSAAEVANDLSEVEGQLQGLVRAVRDDTGHVQRLAGDLRSEITRARMVPIGRLFARFTRQVREAARAEAKSVVLETSGDAVEMDNTIVEQVADPVLHLVRNAIAHGIEPAETRQAAGKPDYGTVRLAAVQKGGAIHIEVADDGRGIDTAVVKQWAVERGFMKPEAVAMLSERDTLDLIFLPGFSTAATVTAGAGRGVGMDVVRTNVARLGGHIDVETEVGVGTRFTIKLPLTVAISDAFLVRVGSEALAVPVAAVAMILRCGPDDVRAVGEAEMVEVEGQLVDLVRMDRALGLSGRSTAPRVPVLAVRAGRRTVAMAVDEVLGKEEIVVKSLGEFLQGTGPFSGATITGEGRVILLVDPSRLVELGGERAAAGPASTREPRPAAAVERGRRVLLVDDSISIRKFVGQMLERAGFQVVAAGDGVEALERLAEAAVDVVVTDLEMPRLNGYELIRDLRRRPTTRELPIVVLTTRAGDKHAGLARHLGVSHYVTKPVDESSFVRLLGELAAAGTVAVAAS